MDPTHDFDFGTFQIRSRLKGQVDDQPAFEITVLTPAGQADMGLIGSPTPLSAQAALFFIDLLKRALSMGPQRFMQWLMMRERRKPEEIPEQQAKAQRHYAVAKALGKEALDHAYAYLEEAKKEQEADLEKAQAEVAQQIEEAKKIGFDLGPIRMVVEWLGAMPDPEEGPPLALFSVTAIAPNDVMHTVKVATDAPLFSGSAEWLLRQMERVIEIGPERFSEEEAIPQATAGGEIQEPIAYAQSLHSIASVLGPGGLTHAKGILEQAKAEESIDFEKIEITKLEAELKEVRKEIKKLERKKKRPK